ncbi:hypothetical protein K474DRAFT_207938 [Panus rudis PR-1116 ss-1]|nr:hypothetical protein K474DRAFT_207938 [Panus rudis PR-1116 ss-1]
MVLGLSAWLVPPPTVASKLTSQIMSLRPPSSSLPKAPSSASSFPRFDPHITLLTVPSSTPLSEIRDAIPTDQVKIPVRFKSADVGQKYFMSVFVTVHQGSDDGAKELDELRNKLKERFGEGRVPPVSHVSLYYIDDPDADLREAVLEELKNQGRIVPQGNDGDSSGGEVALDCTEGSERGKDLINGFEGTEIWLALCDGPVETWQIKEKILLK